MSPNSQTTSLFVRKAKKTDLPRITEIYNQAIDCGYATGDVDPQSPEERSEWFKFHSQDKYPIWIAEQESYPVGWLSLSPYREGRGAFKQAAEVSYYVDFDHHRKGVVSLLFETVEKHCEEVGIRYLVAFLLAHNKASINLLRKHGYSLKGIFKGIAIIDSTKFDHIYFGKALIY